MMKEQATVGLQQEIDAYEARRTIAANFQQWFIEAGREGMRQEMAANAARVAGDIASEQIRQKAIEEMRREEVNQYGLRLMEMDRLNMATWTGKALGYMRMFLENSSKTMGMLQETVGKKLMGIFGEGGVMKSIIGTGLNAIFGPAGGMMASLVSAGMKKMGEIALEGLKKIGGFFKDLFGGASAKELAGREVVANFEVNLAKMLTETQKLEAGNERWKQTVIAIRDAYIAQGLSEQEALRDAERLWQSSREGAEASKQVIDEITRRMGQFSSEVRDAFNNFPREIEVDVNWDIEPPPDFDSFRHGGRVRKTGLALVHAGETVIPTGGGRVALDQGEHGEGFNHTLAALQMIVRKLDRLPRATRDAVLVSGR
jgi:hypothetical protein